MALALTFVLWALVALFVAFVAVIAMPLRFEARASVGEALRYSVALRPLGRFGPRLVLTDSETPPGEPRRKKQEKPGKKKKKARTGRSRLRDPQRTVRAAFRLVVDILGLLRIETARLDLRFGAGDPAETGEIYGALTPFIYGTTHKSWLWLNVEPVFDGPALEGRAALDVSFTPVRLVGPALRFGWAAFGPRP